METAEFLSSHHDSESNRKVFLLFWIDFHDNYDYVYVLCLRSQDQEVSVVLGS